MRKYLNVSVVISKIALRYIPPEDLHQYSIDEFFMDVTDSYHRFHSTVHALCEEPNVKFLKKQAFIVLSALVLICY